MRASLEAFPPPTDRGGEVRKPSSCAYFAPTWSPWVWFSAWPQWHCCPLCRCCYHALSRSSSAALRPGASEAEWEELHAHTHTHTKLLGKGLVASQICHWIKIINIRRVTSLQWQRGQGQKSVDWGGRGGGMMLTMLRGKSSGLLFSLWMASHTPRATSSGSCSTVKALLAVDKRPLSDPRLSKKMQV